MTGIGSNGFVRPLVRYVDEDQAVIDVEVMLPPPLRASERRQPESVQVLIEVVGDDGFTDEQLIDVRLQVGQGIARFDMVRPQRWWPAGMGGQTLYHLGIRLLHGGSIIEAVDTTIGLISVRPSDGGAPTLLVNSQVCEIHSIVPVYRCHEKQMLPAAGNSLMIVRDHYGTDLLYDAADRAGILLIQCVPIHPEARMETDLGCHVERLVRHPSLVGWYVGHLGPTSKCVARCIHGLDPTRAIFHDVSGLSAA